MKNLLLSIKVMKSNELSYSLAVGWSNPIKWGEANHAKETLE
jgi:hypothetical protein